jgi:type IV pilus assembly protein PilB
MSNNRIGQRLVRAGLISQDQLAFALNEQQRSGDRIGEVMRRLNLITEDALTEALAQAADIDYVHLIHQSIDPAIIAIVPEKVARDHRLFPLSADEGSITIAMADPLDVGAVDVVQRVTGMFVKVVAASEFDILTSIDRFYAAGKQGEQIEVLLKDAAARADADAARESREDLAMVAPVVRLIDEIILDGVRRRATDIHFEPEKSLLRVRYRIDGVLHQGPYIPKKLERPVNSRIKIMGDLNISESRLPQDGKANVEIYGKQIDVRISTFPTIHGENVVLRVLNKEQLAIGMEHLGFSDVNLERLKEAIEHPNGIVLATGPTGSGKTTTLYAALMRISTPERKIITLEDPVEYELPLIRQSQINVRAGLTYATGLRAILRQDPDTVLVGEMRDHETVDTAIRAALTGLLVFSTLHTNDAASTVPRLLDMGVEPYLVASSIVGVVAQRLVRQICEYCREEDHPDERLLKRMGAPSGATFWKGGGCSNCDGTGYRGRTAVAEVMLMTETIRKAIMEREDASAVRKQACAEGMRSLIEDGLARAAEGLTSLDEIARAV